MHLFSRHHDKINDLCQRDGRSTMCHSFWAVPLQVFAELGYKHIYPTKYFLKRNSSRQESRYCPPRGYIAGLGRGFALTFLREGGIACWVWYYDSSLVSRPQARVECTYGITGPEVYVGKADTPGGGALDCFGKNWFAYLWSCGGNTLTSAQWLVNEIREDVG